MRSTKFSRAINAKPERSRVGVVTSVSSDLCMVNIGDGEVPAYLNDQVMVQVVIGAVVTLRRIGDTYEVASTRTGTTGGGGLILGPELLPNASFEFGTDLPTGWGSYPWVSGNYTSTRDAAAGEALSGTARALVTLAAGVDAPIVRFYNLTAVRIDAGVSYQCSAWIKAPAGDASLTCELWAITAPEEVNASPFGVASTTHTVATVANPGAAYQLLTGSFTVPVGHRWVRVYLSAGAAATIAAPVSVSWDLASLRQRITS